MIYAHSLTKRFGSKTAVDNIDFSVTPGRVTGFLGPNGAGKSTTMRMIVGLDLGLTGLESVADKRVRGFSLGMGAQTAEHLIILGRGRVLVDAPLSEILANASGGSMQVRTSDTARLRTLLEAEGAGVSQVEPDLIAATGIAAPRIAEIAAGAGLVVYELTPVTNSLEEARSIRSTWWSCALLVVITVGLSIQISSALAFDWYDGTPTQEGMQAAGVNAVMVGVEISVLVVSVLGVLVIAGEYGTGMIRSTFIAVPKRVPALLGKALVGIGAIVRNTAGGIAVALGLVFAAPLALSLVGDIAPQLWTQNLSTLLPSHLGRALYSHPGYADFASPGLPLERPEGLWILEPWQGAIGLAAWVVVLFAAAIVMLKRRDA